MNSRDRAGRPDAFPDHGLASGVHLSNVNHDCEIERKTVEASAAAPDESADRAFLKFVMAFERRDRRDVAYIFQRDPSPAGDQDWIKEQILRTGAGPLDGSISRRSACVGEQLQANRISEWARSSLSPAPQAASAD
jgi:hypothetical protein